ncbi:hypothetical protein [Catellatospora methionotrophica]|uniref:hypothetical protein n=1 Tax=Catellatospora methionotrophica TaxID=121620 RepID=UPI0033E224D4
MPISPHHDDPHDVVYFRRHVADDARRTAPGQVFLRSCPPTVRAKFFAVLVAVAKAPPHRFAGGGLWEAMHGSMSGWYEVRLDGPKPGGGRGRHHYRLFCLVDFAAIGRQKPLLVVVTGLMKPVATTLSDGDYAAVRRLGEEYHARNPRSIG